MDHIRRDQPLRVRREAQAAAVAVADRVPRDERRAAAADGDAGHLVGEDVVVDDGALAVLTHEHAGVLPVVDAVALDERRALLEDGDARAPVAEDVVVLDAAAPLLTHQHAGVEPVVDFVRADDRVAAREDGDAGAAVGGDHVVLDQPLGEVADEHADALGALDEVVEDVGARVEPLHHQRMPRLRRDGALLHHEERAALDEDGARHRRAARRARLLQDRQVVQPHGDLREGLDGGPVGADDHCAAHTPRADDLDGAVEAEALAVDALADEHAVERRGGEQRRVDRRVARGVGGIDGVGVRARRARENAAGHDLEGEAAELVRGRRAGVRVRAAEAAPVARPRGAARVLRLPGGGGVERIAVAVAEEGAPPDALVDDLAEGAAGGLEAAERARVERVLLQDVEQDVVRQREEIHLTHRGRGG
eukprot:CAMPEP_0195568334 /NCGR_PEP_ID=MMETSP0814-20130614/2174_1 /TAXON_ID=97485 /ORGANISM="Prymnesium parvum, Strain Texoma1" /LENGTH=421 /DNA_ID=CAMNT_0040703619 /DNA_START=438 /DNA_END=1700 /DNA_ORIENTATION=+